MRGSHFLFSAAARTLSLSQALCRGQLPLVAQAHAGAVEHEAFERGNAGATVSQRSSDHRPVSLTLVATT